MSERSLSVRMQQRIARKLLDTLSPLAPKLLSEQGRSRDGLTLSPDLQMMLKLRELQGGKSWSDLSVATARKQMREECRISAGPKLPVGPVRTFEIPGPTGNLRVRHYVSTELGKRPLLVFFHGGGFLFGDLDTHDQPCRYLAKYAGVHVLSVEYRKAPENPFPAAIEDTFAGYLWAVEHAVDLGSDPSQVLVGGDSAGGNLATVVTQLAAREEKTLPCMQLLLYPTIDRVRSWPSVELFAEGFFLTKRDIEYCLEQYAQGHDPKDPLLCPALFPELSALSPAFVVTCGFDPLRDEGEAYESALREAGVKTSLYRVPDVIHGFINMTGLSPTADAALIEVANRTRNFLTTLKQA